MAVTWNYDGATSLSMTTDTVAGHNYTFTVVDGSFTHSDPFVGTGSPMTRTVTPLSGLSSGDIFGGDIRDVTASDYLGTNNFKYGTATTTGFGLSGNWSFDGVNTITFTGAGSAGVSYVLEFDYFSGGVFHSEQGTPFTATGAAETHSLTALNLPQNDLAVSFWTNQAPFTSNASRLVTVGAAGGGVGGNPQGGGPLNGRVFIAFDAAPLDANPTWTCIDQGGSFPVAFVSGYDLTSGRQTLLAQTDTGTATVYINDHDLGLFDPRNSSSPYFGKLDGKQIMLQLQNPVTLVWERQFRGWIDFITWDVDGSAVTAAGQPINESLQIECVDMFDFLAGYGLTPGLDGVTPPTGSEDSVYYAATAGKVDDRIIEVLTDVGIDSSRYLVASGNTRAQRVLYNADESALVALRDAADAELPFIANIYIDRHGNFAFRGRYSRFDPDAVAATAGSNWDFARWAVGDGNAIIADPTRAQMRVLAYTRGRRDIINVALSYPQNTKAADIPGQVFANTASITAYGKHVSPPLTDLLTDTYAGPGTITPNTGLSQCALFAKLLVLNQKDPREAVSALQLKSINPSDSRAAVTWRLMTTADISHIVNVAVGYPHGTGFTGASPTDDYYIEGRQMRVRPANASYDDVELDLEVSPAVWSMDVNGVFPAYGSGPTPQPPQSSSASSPAKIRRLFSPWSMSP